MPLYIDPNQMIRPLMKPSADIITEALPRALSYSMEEEMFPIRKGLTEAQTQQAQEHVKTAQETRAALNELRGGGAPINFSSGLSATPEDILAIQGGIPASIALGTPRPNVPHQYYDPNQRAMVHTYNIQEGSLAKEPEAPYKVLGNWHEGENTVSAVMGPTGQVELKKGTARIPFAETNEARIMSYVKELRALQTTWANLQKAPVVPEGAQSLFGLPAGSKIPDAALEQALTGIGQDMRYIQSKLNRLDPEWRRIADQYAKEVQAANPLGGGTADDYMEKYRKGVR